MLSRPAKHFLLVVALLTFDTTDILHCHAVHLTALDIIMELLVNAVKFIPGTVAVIEINFCLAVTVHAPTHAQFSFLLYFIHFLDISMTGLAGYISYFNMLCMVEINVVWQVMNLYPFR